MADGPPVTSPGRRAAARRSLPAIVALLGVIGVVVCVVAVSVGAVNVPVSRVWWVIASRAGLGGSGATPVEQQIVWDVRAPRVLLGLLAGAGLATAGAVIQAVVRNPLGDPYLLGVVPGASLGAVVVIVAGSGAAFGLSLSAAAFVGAMTAFVATFTLGRQGGRFPATRLVLAGVAVGYLFSAATYFLQTRATPNQVQRVLFWTLGSLSSARWTDLALPAVVVTVAVAWLTVQGRRLNALVTGEEVAGTLGLDVARFQFELMLVSSLLTGVVVAVVGGVGFVGLMVPHIARLLVGSDHRRVVPVSALLGGIFVVAVDVIARTAQRPVELPVGIVTAALGAPFLLWLLREKDRRARRASRRASSTLEAVA